MFIIEKIACPAVPDLAAASWTNAYRVGPEVVMPGRGLSRRTRPGARRDEPL